MASPAYTDTLVASSAPARTTRRRLVAATIAVGLAVTGLAVPQSASAATAAPLTAATARVWATNMIKVLNSERKAHHLPALKANSKLVLSAHRHNALMAKDDTMSHQLPGEAFFADRITKAKYKWRAVGENIGWNSAITNSGLQTLEHEMYNEKAPDNGHRLNILSSSYRQVGIDVYYDKTHKKMWFTQDFGLAA